MSWRTVVISKSSKLDYQMGYMVVRQDITTKIHLGEIAVVIIETTAVSLTVALLSELTKKKVKVIFCDEKRNPSSELISYYGCHDSSMKLKNQIQWTNDQKAYIWTEIVAEKIRQQAMVLDMYNHNEANLLMEYIKEMELGDVTNREGHAAKVYFNALFGKDFTRTSENSINAALNYGYGIILSIFNREIVANGYVTQIGLFHENRFNQFNLGSDLMEVYRPIIDRIVYAMKPKQFETDEKRYILQSLEQEVVIGGRRENINNAIKIYCRSIFEALNESDSSLIKFYRK